MKAVYKSLAAAIVFATAGNVYAEEGGSSISANISLATDYVFRGQSQNNESTAIQGGFDWDSGMGIYAGVWGSNVDFGTDAQAEFDYYFGYAGEITESVGFDIGYIFYTYTGENAFDYEEVALSFSFGDLSLGVNYSDEYLGDGGEDYYYFSGGYDIALPAEVTLSLTTGYNSADDMDITFDGSGDDSYMDWSVGLSKEFEGVSLGLTYFDTDIDGDNPFADSRVVVSLSKSF